MAVRLIQSLRLYVLLKVEKLGDYLIYKHQIVIFQPIIRAQMLKNMILLLLPIMYSSVLVVTTQRNFNDVLAR